MAGKWNRIVEFSLKTQRLAGGELLELRCPLAAHADLDFTTIYSDRHPTYRFFQRTTATEAPFAILRSGQATVTAFTELPDILSVVADPTGLQIRFGDDTPGSMEEVATLATFDNGMGDGVANVTYRPGAMSDPSATLLVAGVPTVDAELSDLRWSVTYNGVITAEATIVLLSPLTTDTTVFDELWAATDGTGALEIGFEPFQNLGAWPGSTDGLIYQAAASVDLPLGDDHTDSRTSATSWDQQQPIDGDIEFPGDADWFEVHLERGTEVTWGTTAGSLEDTLLSLYDATGGRIFSDDDGGPGYLARIKYEAPYTGTYYLQVQAFPTTAVGTYHVEATLVAPTHYFPVLASTIQQLDDADSAAIAVGDVDGDGDVDAVFANFGNGAMGNANTLWFNDGEGNYFDSGLRMDNDITRDVALVDLDLDGDLDAYFANEGADKIWWNDGLGGFTAGAELLSTASSNSVAAADLDNDGDVDLVLMHAYPVPSTIWLNDGTGHFAQSGSLSGGVQQLDAALGDMDRDGDLDIMVVDYFLGKTQVWLNNGSGGFTPAGNGLAIEFATSVALGDLDGDGDLDAFVGRVGDNTVWLNNGSGILSDTSQLLGGSDTHAVALADFDSDGDLDAVTANSRPVGNKVWLNDGTGMFASAGFSWEDHASHDLAVADIDDDDDDDVLLANYLPLDSAPQQGRTNTLWRNILTFPDARDDHVTVIKNSSIDVSVIDNDTPDSDLRVVDIGSAPHGTPTNLGNGTVRFVPEPNYVGEATFEYTIAIDPVEIVANNGHAADWFGTSVSVDGKWAVVGAPLEDEKGTSTGAAYVYQRTGNHWTLQTKLTAPDWKKLDQFGQSVAISGDTIVVGSWLSDSTPVGSNGGAAYVFQRRPEFEDRWDMVAKLVGSGTTAADRFGTSVAIDGDVIVVGAELDDPVGSASGAAYVFERHAGGANQWNETAALVASGASSGDRFGKSVSVSGGTVIVGSWFDDVGASNSGAAYIFERHNGTWSETAKLSPSSPTANDQFGVSVAASGSTVVVSAWLDDYDLNPFRSNTGAVYVYQRVNAVWQETVRLLPAAPPSSGERLGTSIDIDGDRIAVGAYLADASGVDSGRVLLFARSAAGTWSQQAELHNLGSSTNDRFGNSVAIDRSVIVAGSYLEDAAATNSGAVTVFDLRQDTATVTLSYVEPVSLLPVSQPIAIFSGSNAAAADHPMMPMVRRESAQRSWVHDPLAGARAENAADSSAPKQHRRAHSRSIASNAVIAIDLDEPDWI